MPRPVIGLVCKDLKMGVSFYQQLEAMMAILWPDETQRPIIYGEFGLDSSSTADVVKSKSCDCIFNLSPEVVVDSGDLPELPKKTKNLMNELRSQSGVVLTAQEARIFHKLCLRMGEYTPPAQPKVDDHNVVSVIGGMGPIAGANFLRSLAESLDDIDVDEETTIKLYSNPQLPGKHIPSNECIDCIKHTADYLGRFRDFVNNAKGVLVAPCNTFHTNVPNLSYISAINEKILHIVKQVETRMFSDDRFQTVAVMGAERTVDKGLYEGIFEGSGKTIFSLKDHPKYKKLVQEGINLVKAGQATAGGDKFREVIDFIKEKSPGSPIILGCTEIVVGCKAVGMVIEYPLYDSASILAEATAQQVLLSSSEPRNEQFQESRDIDHFVFSLKQNITRFQLLESKNGRNIDDKCEELLEKITQIFTDNKKAPIQKYKEILKILISDFVDPKMNSQLRPLLGKLISPELPNLDLAQLKEFSAQLDKLPEPQAEVQVQLAAKGSE
ncbi:aspartate/glutamate racemase family protein [Legionella waltersii]|uniref:Aspartate racemase n=1 Tax=Legionella waltersii TaxID=66969 RepID=A0A0W1AKA8_9GAMM|nr:aspartate/glutamate racemase family protein [Legionella waltersii]KTD81764.1 Aspartate racemase [Legionella waltersii]SNU97165.1 Aspartate racemase [Legionella waltersii]